MNLHDRTLCFICGQAKRPLLEAMHAFTREGIDYDMKVWACLDCLGIKRSDA